MTESTKQILDKGEKDSNQAERGFSLVDYSFNNLENITIPTVVGIVMNNMNKTIVDKDYGYQLLFAKKYNRYFRNQDKEDLELQQQSKKRSTDEKESKQERKVAKNTLTKLTYFKSQLVKDEIQLDAIIDNNKQSNMQKVLVFLKQQIIGYKYCYKFPKNNEVSIVMSSKSDPNVGSLQELTKRLKDVIKLVNNNNLQRIHTLSNTEPYNSIYNDITKIGTQSEYYLDLTDHATKYATDLINKVHIMNDYYHPIILQNWLNIVLPKWLNDDEEYNDLITNEQKYLKVGAIFKIKNVEKTYVFYGMLYIKTEYIAYYHDSNNIECIDNCLNMKLVLLIDSLDR